MTYRSWVILPLWLVLVAGCSSPVATKGPETMPPPKEESSQDAPTAKAVVDANKPVAGNADFKLVALDELKKQIAARKGKVVVIDVWANY